MALTLAGRRLSAIITRLSFEHLDEGFLRDLNAAEGFHAFLTFFLFFEQLALTGDVAAVAFRSDVFAHGADGFARDDLATDGGLDGHTELLLGNDLFQLRGERAAA